MATFPKLSVTGHTHFPHDVVHALAVKVKQPDLCGIAKSVFAPGATTTSPVYFRHIRKVDHTFLIEIRKVVMVSHHHTRIMNRA